MRPLCAEAPSQGLIPLLFGVFNLLACQRGGVSPTLKVGKKRHRAAQHPIGQSAAGLPQTLGRLAPGLQLMAELT